MITLNHRWSDEGNHRHPSSLLAIEARDFSTATASQWHFDRETNAGVCSLVYDGDHHPKPRRWPPKCSMFNVSSQNHRLDLRYSRIPKISKVLKTSSNWFHHEITWGSTNLHWSWSSYLHLAAKDASSSGTLLAWAASMLMAVALLV